MPSLFQTKAFQSTGAWLQRLKAFWPLMYVAAVMALILPTLLRWGYDDPYITYRYAVSLARGLGFVYNPGERVLSTTTPLLAILLSALFKLGVKPHPAAVIIGAASLAAGALFLWQLARAWHTPLIGWTGLLLYPAFPLIINTTSSETPLTLALCLGAFAAYARERYSITALFSALACLTRPDSLLVPVLLITDLLFIKKQPFPWRAAWIFAAITMPWILFAWIYFGSPIPATYFAKLSQGTLAISRGFAAGFFARIFSGIGGWEWQIRYILAIFGCAGLLKWGKSWGLFFAWLALYFTSYTVMGVTSYFWYYAPLFLGLLVCSGAGVEAISRVVKTNKKLPTWLPGLAIAGLFVLLFAANTHNFLLFRQETDFRMEIFRAAGQWLKKHTPPGSAVGTLEVGIMGFFSNRNMIDFAGLLQPEIAQQLHSSDDYETGALYAHHTYQPEFFVLNTGVFPQLENQLSIENCKKIQRFKGKKFSAPWDLLIYDCR